MMHTTQKPFGIFFLLGNKCGEREKERKKCEIFKKKIKNRIVRLSQHVVCHVVFSGLTTEDRNRRRHTDTRVAIKKTVADCVEDS